MVGNGVLEGFAFMATECGTGTGGCVEGDGNDLPLNGWHGYPNWLSLWKRRGLLRRRFVSPAISSPDRQAVKFIFLIAPFNARMSWQPAPIYCKP
jgi:hypothetical protein